MMEGGREKIFFIFTHFFHLAVGIVSAALIGHRLENSLFALCFYI